MPHDPVVDHVLIALAPLGVRTRAMFGGYGLYLGDKFFGLVNDGRVFFRTDEMSRPDYVARGMPPFQPHNRPVGPRTVARNFQVPEEVSASTEEHSAQAQELAATASQVRTVAEGLDRAVARFKTAA